MKRIKDPTHVSVTPKYFTVPQNGRRIEWRSDLMPLSSFLNQVFTYCDANGFPRPSEDAVQDELCRQMPARDCVGEGYHVPQPVTVESGRSGGCRGGCR